MATLLLLPGLSSDGDVWRAVSARMAPPMPVVVGDLSRQDDLTAMAEGMLATNPGPLHLAGHSMGGRAATEMARLADTHQAVRIRPLAGG
jgi:pimeloyl-ACP methyl ester carboxylesterase